jgi:phosphoribosylanthranilate isomerase
MRPLIKICGMRDSDNIIAAAELKPDLMGFIFYRKSPRYAGDVLDPELLAGLPPAILKTGVFVNATFNEIIATAKKYSLNAVQLHGDEPPELCSRIKDAGISVIKAFSADEEKGFSISSGYLSSADYFLFDTMTSRWGGSGRKFNWELLEKYDKGHPFILSGGISPGDEESIMEIRNPSFSGVDLNSRFEIRPGLKDIKKLKEFINALKANYKIL